MGRNEAPKADEGKTYDDGLGVAAKRREEGGGGGVGSGRSNEVDKGMGVRRPRPCRGT